MPTLVFLVTILTTGGLAEFRTIGPVTPDRCQRLAAVAQAAHAANVARGARTGTLATLCIGEPQ